MEEQQHQVDKKSTGKEKDCTLNLQPFSKLEVTECCPYYMRLLSADVALPATAATTGGDASAAKTTATEKKEIRPTIADLETLIREVDLMRHSTTYRVKQISEEFQKADIFVKLNKEAVPAAATAEDGATPVGTLNDVAPTGQAAAQPAAKGPLLPFKLKLKASSLVTEDAKAKRRKQDGSPNLSKRKKTDVELSEASDFDKTYDPNGRASPLPKEKILKKKQRKDSLLPDQFVKQHVHTQQQQQQQSVEPSETPGPSHADEGKVVKPSQQILSTTFWNYVDAYFRKITEDDIRLLETADDDNPEPFILFPLGRHYRQTWAEEDKSLLAKQPLPAETTATASSSPSKKEESNSEIFCGQYTERVLSALMEDDTSLPGSADMKLQNGGGGGNETDISDFEDTASSSTQLHPVDISKEELYSLEDRIKRELRYIGLLDDEEASNLVEEDEISRELRRLQDELRRLAGVNKNRRAVVYDAIVQRLAYQEYNMVLDELNKQIEQTFLKRQRIASAQKRKKKVMGVKMAPDGVRALIERRQKLIHEFEPIFTKESVRMPDDSIFDEEEDVSGWIEKIQLEPPAVTALGSGEDLFKVPGGASQVELGQANQMDAAAAAHSTTSAQSLTATAVAASTATTAPSTSNTPSLLAASGAADKTASDVKPRKKYTKKPKAALTGTADSKGTTTAAAAAAAEAAETEPKEKKKTYKKRKKDEKSVEPSSSSSMPSLPTLESTTAQTSKAKQAAAGGGGGKDVEGDLGLDAGALPDWMYDPSLNL